MQIKLNASQKELHQRALAICREFGVHVWRVIEVLQELDKAKLYKCFGCSSLFMFAVDHLKLDRELAYQMITAARRCREVPALGEAIKEQRLTLGKAVRIFSTVTPENARELLAFAETHTAEQINREVSRIRKGQGLPEKLRNVKVSEDTYSKVKRAQAVLGKKGRVDPDQVINLALEEFLERHDPVRKAKRAVERKNKKRTENDVFNERTGSAPNNLTSSDVELCTYRVPRREPLTAEQKHEVFARDEGQCTHKDINGIRCANDRYLHVHHIRPVSHGGSNEPANLTTLCSFHHDLAHQLTLPIEGQVTWLRSPVVKYEVKPRRRQ